MPVEITNYGMAWDVDAKMGYIEMRTQSGVPVKLQRLSAEEFTAIATILNESPVYWFPDQKMVSTYLEPVGGT
jgi:hypothetical protein